MDFSQRYQQQVIAKAASLANQSKTSQQRTPTPLSAYTTTIQTYTNEPLETSMERFRKAARNAVTKLETDFCVALNNAMPLINSEYLSNAKERHS